MKGQGLPINTMIIIVVSVIALLAIVLLFVTSWGSGAVSISSQAAWNEACSKWKRNSCSSGDFTGGGEGKEEISVMFNGDLRTIAYICRLNYGENVSESFCRNLCCGGYIPDI